MSRVDVLLVVDIWMEDGCAGESVGAEVGSHFHTHKRTQEQENRKSGDTKRHKEWEKLQEIMRKQEEKAAP